MYVMKILWFSSYQVIKLSMMFKESLQMADYT